MQLPGGPVPPSLVSSANLNSLLHRVRLSWDLTSKTRKHRDFDTLRVARHRNEKVKLSDPNLARSDFVAKSEEMPLMVRGGGLRTAVKTSAAVELLVGPRSDTPAHREWGPMSWHGRFGRADVNVQRRWKAAMITVHAF